MAAERARRAAGIGCHGTIGHVRWRVLIPIKQLDESKSRLSGTAQPPSRHPELVRALQLDTLAAVVQARDLSTVIAGIYLVTEQPPEQLPFQLTVLSDPGGGLNAALAYAAGEIHAEHQQDGVAAMVADLPALRPAELLAALTAAQQFDRAFVPDLAGSGTTMLTGGPGRALQPQFGPESAALHRASGATELVAGDSLRCDVDTAADLQRCLQLGLGAHTARMVAHLV
jgi:2-phospho-L-lactate/phosphoenolpyruvate guanylyltransferase